MADPGPIDLQRFPVEAWAALGAALDRVPSVAMRRRTIQARRAVPDADVLPRLGRPFEYARSTASYRNVQDALVHGFGLREVVKGRARVLFITDQALTAAPPRSGPDLLRLGRNLSRRVSVTIASPDGGTLVDECCALAPYASGEWGAIRQLVLDADVFVVSPAILHAHPTLAAMQTPIVIDMREWGSATEAIGPAGRLALTHGDFFMVADEQVRASWLGALHTLGRANSFTYATDPTLRNFVDVLPANASAGDVAWARGVDALCGFCATAEFAADRGVAIRALHKRLADGYRVSKWLKRVGLSLGLSETRIEQAKRLKPVRLVTGWRDRLALARARGAVARRQGSGEQR